MDFHGFNREEAINHCVSIESGPERALGNVRSWNRLNPEHIVELLHAAGPEARQDARNLAAQLTRSNWRIQMDARDVGKTQLVANSREVLITAGGRDYRLLLSEGSSLQLDRITQAA